MHLFSLIPKLSSRICNQFIISQLLYFVHSSISHFIEWSFGQSSVAPLSAALLRALLRWWWKDLSNGITHRDKCSEPSGSSHLPPAFQRAALIHCAVAYLGYRVFWGDVLSIYGGVVFDRLFTHITGCLSSSKIVSHFVHSYINHIRFWEKLSRFWFVNWNKSTFNPRQTVMMMSLR